MTDQTDGPIEEELAQQEAAQRQQDVMARGHQLRKIIDLGFQVGQFLDSDLGKRLEHDARTERLTLTEKYILLNPDVPKERDEMSDIRLRVHVLNAWQEFFADYIQQGVAAQQQYMQEDQVE